MPTTLTTVLVLGVVAGLIVVALLARILRGGGRSTAIDGGSVTPSWLEQHRADQEDDAR